MGMMVTARKLSEDQDQVGCHGEGRRRQLRPCGRRDQLEDHNRLEAAGRVSGHGRFRKLIPPPRLEFDHRGAVSLETENVTAAYACSEVLSDMTGSGSTQEASPVRLVVELARNLGGMRMRALIGAEFRSGHAPFGFQICVMGRPFLRVCRRPATAGWALR
jgi:hypothetical protein